MNKMISENIYSFYALEGKSAIVTGAGNGIGKATARLLAAFGANVMLCDIEEESAEAAAGQICAEGGRAVSMYCDITDRDLIEKTVNKTVEEFGTVDILVNNGATLGGGKPIAKVDPPEFARLIDTNLTGVFYFIYAVLPIMRAKKYGKIINISSGAGVVGGETDFHYAAAKGGVIAMSKGLARELGHESINVNVVAPGLTNTRMAHEWEFEPALKRFYRVGEPVDMAAAVVFLASDAAGYFSGQVISPNGGEYMI
ncbi:SDR family NAD(P)-dependent oxidoreductase [Bacilliculturomica massiliensis]|uniref:SDR family NAD(P)-dependent oxidoreductase n=1 Tax=Bacilliculturomica massiliensis TaxID=1917867 RepID=UPI0010309A08|nr:SDR family NAD(P)-dependent oxidoreductase [Bacilliculturomica massiliensis]